MNWWFMFFSMYPLIWIITYPSSLILSISHLLKQCMSGSFNVYCFLYSLVSFRYERYVKMLCECVGVCDNTFQHSVCVSWVNVMTWSWIWMWYSINTALVRNAVTMATRLTSLGVTKVIVVEVAIVMVCPSQGVTLWFRLCLGAGRSETDQNSWSVRGQWIWYKIRRAPWAKTKILLPRQNKTRLLRQCLLRQVGWCEYRRGVGQWRGKYEHHIMHIPTHAVDTTEPHGHIAQPFLNPRKL